MVRSAPRMLGLVVIATLGCSASPDPASEPVHGEARAGLSVETKLATPIPDVGSFGATLSFADSRMIVGDPSYGASPNYQRGAAWIFELGAGGWVLHGQPKPADGPGNQKAFGHAVAIDGDVAVVSEPGDPEVHVFGYSGGAWVQEGAFTFGFQDVSLAVSGDTFVVGAPKYWNGTLYSGAAYVYRRSAGTWSLEATLVPQDPGDGDVGTAIALDGDTLLVGGASGGSTIGGAYVFVRSGTTWTEQAKLSPPAGATWSGLFGSAVALDGDTAVVGSHLEDLSGRAYVFARSGSTWSAQATLAPPSTGSNEYFAFALALDQDRLAVGAPLAKPAGVGSGAVYTFARTGATWTPSVTVVPSDGVSGDYFGRTVGLVGDRVAVGAPFQTQPSGLKGAVYVYDLVSPNGKTCASGSDCESGFCVDGVCCDTACGNGLDDCVACSIAEGAPDDGICAPVSPGTPCDDGDPCTDVDMCSFGTCVPGSNTCGSGGSSGSAGSGGNAGSAGSGGHAGSSGSGGHAGSAGSGGSAGSAGSGGNAGSAGGSAGAANVSGNSDSGCGCRLASDPGGQRSAWLALLGLVALVARRRVYSAPA